MGPMGSFALLTLPLHMPLHMIHEKRFIDCFIVALLTSKIFNFVMNHFHMWIEVALVSCFVVAMFATEIFYLVVKVFDMPFQIWFVVTFIWALFTGIVLNIFMNTVDMFLQAVSVPCGKIALITPIRSLRNIWIHFRCHGSQNPTTNMSPTLYRKETEKEILALETFAHTPF